MASLIEAIEIKRKMFFELDNAPYHCLDVDISKPTARGGQTLVRIKMRNLLTKAVFDRTFKAGDKFKEPDLEKIAASYLYADADGYHFMDQETFETLTISADMLGDDRLLLVDNVIVFVQKYNGSAIGIEFPPHVELTVASTEPGTRGDTASGNVTKIAKRSKSTPKRASSLGEHSGDVHPQKALTQSLAEGRAPKSYCHAE
jgi:elongation factor P